MLWRRRKINWSTFCGNICGFAAYFGKRTLFHRGHKGGFGIPNECLQCVASNYSFEYFCSNKDIQPSHLLTCILGKVGCISVKTVINHLRRASRWNKLLWTLMLFLEEKVLAQKGQAMGCLLYWWISLCWWMLAYSLQQTPQYPRNIPR